MGEPGIPFTHTLRVEPHAKKRPRISAPRAGQRPRTHQDPADKAAETRTRELLIEWQAVARVPQFTSNVEIRATFYRSNKIRVDLDNLAKHLLDCMNGLLFVDDCQVTRVRFELEYDKLAPRTELLIRRTESTMERDLA